MGTGTVPASSEPEWRRGLAEQLSGWWAADGRLRSEVKWGFRVRVLKFVLLCYVPPV